MRRYQEMTIINWEALYCTFRTSGKNYKGAQIFRESFDETLKAI